MTAALRHHPDLFAASHAEPPGFRYAAALVSEREERDLIRQFETLPFKPFEFHGYLGNRRIVSFGHRYDYSAQRLKASDAIPGFLQPLLEIAGRFSSIPSTDFQQVLVTEYAPGAGIGWHRDKPMFQDVVGLSFLSPCVLRLRRKRDSTWERRSVPIAPRSAYLLHGPAREEWEHSIAPMDALRYSVTLRTLRAA